MPIHETLTSGQGRCLEELDWLTGSPFLRLQAVFPFSLVSGSDLIKTKMTKEREKGGGAFSRGGI